MDTTAKTMEVSKTKGTSGASTTPRTASQVDVTDVATISALAEDRSSPGTGRKTARRRKARKRAPSKDPAHTGATRYPAKKTSDTPNREPPTTEGNAAKSQQPGEAQETAAERSASKARGAARVRKATGTGPVEPKEEPGRPAATGRPAQQSRPAATRRRGRRRAHEASAGTEESPVNARQKAPEPTPTDVRAAPPTPDQRHQTPDLQTGRAMLINVSGDDECRIAVLHDSRLEELFIERASTMSHVGNIYKGRVTNIEPSIQAAFVDFGLAQNGFLHMSDVQPQYFPDHKGEAERVGRKIPRHTRPPIQNCLRRGQDVIVQVIKEGVGTKGPTLSTYLSIPGRFLVMMPGMNRHGVSRKIEDEAERRNMRELLKELNLPSGIGFILRTAGLGRSKRELQRDLSYLTRLWKTVTDRIKGLSSPAELYQESDLLKRTIRDVYTADFKRVIVDDAETAKKAREFLQLAMPRTRAVVELYTDRKPLFHRYGIEKEIERINMRHVPLPSGGSLVIDTTEAMVTIDVNSGRSRMADDAEETAYRINIEAAEEIARQLRLRDLGGLIVCDFIDMRMDSHKRAVERALKDALKRHKERAKILRMSAFGLIEMTRQRQGPSLKRNIYYDCPHCKGSGVVKMPDSVVLEVIRILQLATHHAQVRKVIVTAASSTAFQILNRKRAVLNRIETETGKEIIIRGDPTFTSDQIECLCEDSRGRPVYAVPAQSSGTRVGSS